MNYNDISLRKAIIRIKNDCDKNIRLTKRYVTRMIDTTSKLLMLVIENTFGKRVDEENARTALKKVTSNTLYNIFIDLPRDSGNILSVHINKYVKSEYVKVKFNKSTIKYMAKIAEIFIMHLIKIDLIGINRGKYRYIIYTLEDLNRIIDKNLEYKRIIDG